MDVKVEKISNQDLDRFIQMALANMSFEDDMVFNNEDITQTTERVKKITKRDKNYGVRKIQSTKH